MNRQVKSLNNYNDMDEAPEALGAEYEAFLYSLLHGLNNPLTLLLNTSKELNTMLNLEKVDKTLLRKHIEGIVESSEEIESLSRNVLVSSRILGRHGHAYHESIRVCELFDSLCLTNEGKASRKRQELNFINGDPESVVFSDRFFAITILGNLLDNAIKYSGFDTRIDVEWRQDDSERCSIAVSDQGPGIGESDKSRLFTRFSRLPARPTAGESSQGLGLYVARSLAVLNGGSLELVPSEEGARFELSFPACLQDKSKSPIF